MSNDFANLSFDDLRSGAHCCFKVLPVMPIPDSIEVLDDEGLRQRARDAWIAASELRALWGLWDQFLQCGSMGTIPDATTQSAIAARFPELAAMGRILEALHSTRKPRGNKKEERDRADKLAGISRGPIKRMSRAERKELQGNVLQQLRQSFQNSIRARVRSLLLLKVAVPEFQQSAEWVIGNALVATAVTLDLTGDRPPIDFSKATLRLTDSGYRKLRTAVRILIEQLESRPTVVVRSDSENDDDADPIGDDLATAEDGLTEDELQSTSYLGVRLADNGEISRDNLDGSKYLTKIQAGVVKQLLAAAGSVVGFDCLRRAWPYHVDDVPTEIIHTAVSKLRKEVKSLGLRIENNRGVGYRLTDET